VAGLIENMSYFTCGKCSEKHYLFGQSGARQAAQDYQIPFLGEVPIHPDISRNSDDGTPIVVSAPHSEQAKVYRDIADSINQFLLSQPAPEDVQVPIIFE
jgi:ATP-binding protein involved in chromosome partitioning